MEIVEIVGQPQNIAFVVLAAWNIYLQRQLDSLQGRYDRLLDRQDNLRSALIKNTDLTKTDLQE